MSDSFSEVSSQSWFSRIQESIKGVLIGGILFLVSFPVLWWNEGRAVQTAKSLAEGAAAVVAASPQQVDSANDQKLVHLTGEAVTDETLSDSEFDISATALNLQRTVEMYQWKENKETKKDRQTGGSEKTTTTYTYEKVWSDGAIDSGEFKKPQGHQNPGSMPYKSKDFMAQQVTLGAYRLTNSQVGRVRNAADRRVGQEDLARLGPEMRSQFTVHNGAFYRPQGGIPAADRTEAGTPPAPTVPAGAADSDPSFTAPASQGEGATPAAEEQPTPVEEEEPAAPAVAAEPAAVGEPQIGDIRVTFAVVKPTTVSLIAQQANGSFQPYQTKAGDKLDMLEVGADSVEEMFASAVASNNTLTWILRAVGFGVMFVGVTMVFSPLAVMADVIPIMGNLLRTGTAVFAFAVAAPLSLFTIAMAWVFYRPLLGIALIVLAAAIVVGLLLLFRRKPASGVGDVVKG